MFQERLKTDEDIYLNEFSYPVMQAYDSVVLNVDLEIGGNDQMFNMLLGRKLMRHMLRKDKFVMTTPLLTDSEGRKIGKTEGNVIALTDKPAELFGKIMALPDDIILKGFEYLTNIPMDEIKEIEKNIKTGDNPIKFKKQLAFEITKDLNNADDAKKAQEAFQKTVQQKELPDEITEVKINTNDPMKLDQLLFESGLTLSKAEAKRLIEQGAVQIGDTKITNPTQIIELKDNLLLKAGKRKIIRLKTTK
jgi:tyrosyl-tRNA synthetase